MSFVPLGVLLALSIAALVGAGMRVAARTGSVGVERVVATAVLAAAAAVTEALGLGLIGLGSSPVALSAAAGVTWLAARRLPAPAPRPRRELAAWWRELDRPRQLAGVFVTVAAVYFVTWLLGHPYVGFDAGLYHWPEVAMWVQSGRPGQAVAISYDFPFTNYPVTDEVLMTWGAGIARSWIPVVLWPVAAFGLCGSAAWTGLRTLRIPRPAAGAAVAALLLMPWVVRQLNETGNDLSALTWTVTTAALCAGAPYRPRLLPFAVVSAGLALGTKTTPFVFVAVALVLAGLAARRRLHRLREPLLVAVWLAVAVGGLWYLRNLTDHGSPLWPFKRLPGADPIPRIITLLFQQSLVSRAGPTLDGHLGDYARLLAGGVLLLVATPAAMIAVRTPAVLVAGYVTFLGLFVWAVTPGTGLPTSKIVFFPEGIPQSTTRYLLPVLAAAIVTVALAARDGPRATRAICAAVLVAATVWSGIAAIGLRPGIVPPADALVGVAVLGTAIFAGLTGVLAHVRRAGDPALRLLRRTTSSAAGVAMLVALLGGLLATAGDGWVYRAALSRTSQMVGLPALNWYASESRLRTTDRVTFAGWAMIGPLAGDRFQHRLSLLPAEAPCAEVRAAARRGWLVTTEPGVGYGFFGLTPFSANTCMAGVKPRLADQERIYGPPSA